MHRRTVGLALAAPATLLAAVALTASSADSSDGVTVVTDAGTTALVATQSGAGMEAQILGHVALAEGGCVAIDGADNVLPAVWPRGTRLEDGELVLPSGARLEVGDEVDGGGGQVSVSAISGDVPEPCSGPTVVVISTIDPAGR